MGCYYSQAKNLPKIGLLLGVQKTLQAQFGPRSPFQVQLLLHVCLTYTLCSTTICCMLWTACSFSSTLKYFWTPYPCFKYDKSFHVQLKSHSFFLAPIHYSFLDLVEQCLLFFLLHKLLKSRNQVLITFGFPKVIRVVAYLQQLLVINKCSNELDRINRDLSEWDSGWVLFWWN